MCEKNVVEEARKRRKGGREGAFCKGSGRLLVIRSLGLVP